MREKIKTTKDILIIIFYALALLLRISWILVSLKVKVWFTRKRYKWAFKRSLKPLPKDLADELVRQYDYKLKKAFKYSVKDFAKLWGKR